MSQLGSPAPYRHQPKLRLSQAKLHETTQDPSNQQPPPQQNEIEMDRPKVLKAFGDGGSVGVRGLLDFSNLKKKATAEPLVIIKANPNIQSKANGDGGSLHSLEIEDCVIEDKTMVYLDPALTKPPLAVAEGGDKVNLTDSVPGNGVVVGDHPFGMFD